MVLVLFFCFLFVIKSNYVGGSQCGNGTIPFSFEALEDGQPILGCAKATCLGWLPNGTHVGGDVKFLKMEGHPDGYLRSQDFKIEDIVIDKNSPQSIVRCEEKFYSKHCGKSGEWVGGIKPVPYEKLLNTSLKMKCCFYDKLLDSFDQGVAEINPGQIIIGGEIFKNGKQVAFEYITDIHKKIEYGRILYTVTTRRFKCGKASDDDKQHIGRRKLKKVNVLMKTKIDKEKMKKQMSNKINIDKNKKNFAEIAFVKLLEEIQLTENAITKGKMNKSKRYKIQYQKNPKKDIRMSPRKNINLDVVEVNESNRSLKPRFQAYWDANENKWKYKTFVRSEGVSKYDGDILFPSDDSIISESYNEKEKEHIPPIPVTVKPRFIKKVYETDVYVKIPKRTSEEPQLPITERLKLPETPSTAPPTFPPTTTITPELPPQRTINWFGQQLVPGKTYKVYDTITPELSYEFTVPEIFEPLATLPPQPSIPGMAPNPLDILNTLQSQSPTLEQTLRTIISPPPQPVSSNIRRSPVLHDIPVSTETKRDGSLILNRPLPNIVIEQIGDKVNVVPQKNINEIVPEGGREIFNNIAKTLLGEYYNRLML
uniref:WxxW domain-containing protein n=1 Tax=Strongyloides venezuelensis TaxID=75913 RepID=A0A0K0EZN1_STRVS